MKFEMLILVITIMCLQVRTLLACQGFLESKWFKERREDYTREAASTECLADFAKTKSDFGVATLLNLCNLHDARFAKAGSLAKREDTFIIQWYCAKQCDTECSNTLLKSPITCTSKQVYQKDIKDPEDVVVDCSCGLLCKAGGDNFLTIDKQYRENCLDRSKPTASAAAADTTTAKSETTPTAITDATTTGSAASSAAASTGGSTGANSDLTTAASSDATTAGKSDSTTASSSEATTAGSSATATPSSEATTGGSSATSDATTAGATSASNSEATSAASSVETTASNSEATSAGSSSSATTAQNTAETTAAASDSTTAAQSDATTAASSDATTAGSTDASSGATKAANAAAPADSSSLKELQELEKKLMEQMYELMAMKKKLNL